MALCHSVNAGSMVGIPCGSGDTQALPYIKEFVWNFCGRGTKSSGARTGAISHAIPCTWKQ